MVVGGSTVHFRVLLIVLTTLWGWSNAARAQQTMDFEARFGLFGQIVESHTDRTDPIYGHAELLLPTLGPGSPNPFFDVLLSPRPHIGATVAAGSGVNQVFAGLTWDLAVTEAIAFEVSFGGTFHDGPNTSGDRHAPELGCSLLFREAAAVTVAITTRLTVTAVIDHSSNAGF